MIISHSKKFIFVKSRKTAGSSIQIYLSRFCDSDTDIIVGSNAISGKVDQSNSAGVNRPVTIPMLNHPHAPLGVINDYLKSIGKDIADYFVFTIVRNPYDIAVSRYHWNLRKAGIGNTASIEGFRRYLQMDEFKQSSAWDNLFQFTHIRGELLSQMFIAQYEKLNEHFKVICDRLNIPYENLGHYKKTNNRKHYSFYYKDNDRDHIDKNQVDYFNYEFEPYRFFIGVKDRKQVLDMDDVADNNINGVTIIPHQDKLLMFYAHHRGSMIRKATMKSYDTVDEAHLESISVSDVNLRFHIASPDIYYDPIKDLYTMYYHGDIEGGQQFTYRSNTKDFETWNHHPEIVGHFYFRRFGRYAIAKKNNDGGIIYELSSDSKERWIEKMHLIPNMRHAYPYVENGVLHLFYTRVGDIVEHIRVRVINMENWEQIDDYELMRPKETWEGADYKKIESKFGKAHGRQNQLRDPFVLEYNDKIYLYYIYAGESGIAVANLQT